MGLYRPVLAGLFLLVCIQAKAQTRYYLNVKFFTHWPLASLIVQLQDDNGQHCYVIHDQLDISTIVSNLNSTDFMRVSDEEFQTLSEGCDSYGLYSMATIWPGTKWCGEDDIAENFDDLGEEVELDKCCRTHDFCDLVKPGESVNGLLNNSPFVRMACHCDRDFYNCLQSVKNIAADSLGGFYFNMVQNMCYDYEHPAVECTKRPRRGNCDEYQFDTSKSKVWQFLEPRLYEPTRPKKI